MVIVCHVFFTLKTLHIIRDNGTKLKQSWCPRIHYCKCQITFLFKIFDNYVQRIIGIYSHYGTKALILKKTLKWIKFIIYSQTKYVKAFYLFPRNSYLRCKNLCGFFWNGESESAHILYAFPISMLRVNFLAFSSTLQLGGI